MRSIAAVLAVLLPAGVAACRDAQPAPVVVTVDVARPGNAIPDDFLGLSFEASVLGSERLSPSGSNLTALLRLLGNGHLRFGGNSLDRVALWAVNRVTPNDLERLGTLSAATGWRVDLGLTLGHFDPRAAAAEASVAARLIGPGLNSVEIGNEPDLYAVDRGLKPHGYTFADYRAEVAAYRAAITVAAPGARIAGPDTAGLEWLPAYARDERARLSFLTQHFYPLTRCGGRRPTIADLLSTVTRQRQTQFIDRAVTAARASGLPIRVNETNSASCGGQDGVSNTLASALWMVDYLLLAGQRGVAGVDVQGGLAVCRGYTPLCVRGATESVPASRPGIDPVADASLGAAAGTGPLAVQPDFYGLLLVRHVVGGRWLAVTSEPPSPLRTFGLLMPDGSVRVVLVNPRASTSDVVIHAAGRRAVTQVVRLTGPSLGATSGTRLDGAAVSADGTWKPVTDRRVRTVVGGVRVDVAPWSAAVVSLSR